MAYRIIYGEEPCHAPSCSSKPNRILPMSAGFLLLFLLLTGAFWPEGRAKLENLLLPGDPQVTKSALVQMVEDLRTGEAPGDAVVTFCREVMDGASGD